LKFIIPHGGERCRITGVATEATYRPWKKPLEEIVLDNVFFDTCVYWQPGLELLLKSIPASTFSTLLR